MTDEKKQGWKVQEWIKKIFFEKNESPSIRMGAMMSIMMADWFQRHKRLTNEEMLAKKLIDSCDLPLINFYRKMENENEKNISSDSL